MVPVTTDIIYLAAEGVRVYFNQSGNRWSDVRVLQERSHAIDNMGSVQVADLFGKRHRLPGLVVAATRCDSKPDALHRFDGRSEAAPATEVGKQSWRGD